MGTPKTGEKLGTIIVEPKVKALIPTHQPLETAKCEKYGKFQDAV